MEVDKLSPYRVPTDLEEGNMVHLFLSGQSVNHIVFLLDYKFRINEVTEAIRKALAGYKADAERPIADVVAAVEKYAEDKFQIELAIGSFLETLSKHRRERGTALFVRRNCIPGERPL